MKVNFGTISITEESRKLVNEILLSGRVTQGRYVQNFEERFARLVGAKEAVALSSGTDADTLALAVLYDFGAERGDEVIVPALSFIATGNAVLHAGFKPVFVDIGRRTLNIDPEKIESAITDKTRAIMPVHLMGKPADMDAINSLAKKYNLYVIEDAAEAHGAVYKGKNAGNLADMAAFSLYAAHIISAIEGGVITTNNSAFAEIIRSLRSHGRACKCKVCVTNTASTYCAKRFNRDNNADIRFIFERVGFSSKMNELEAAIGLGNLDHYSQILKRRRDNLLYMIEKIREFEPYLYTIQEESGEEIGPHAFPVILKENLNFSRDEFVYFLEERGIDSRSLFSSMPTQCPGFKYLGYRPGEFPEAEYIGNNGFHIGIHQDLKREELDYVIAVIKEFIVRNA